MKVPAVIDPLWTERRHIYRPARVRRLFPGTPSLLRLPPLPTTPALSEMALKRFPLTYGGMQGSQLIAALVNCVYVLFPLPVTLFTDLHIAASTVSLS